MVKDKVTPTCVVNNKSPRKNSKRATAKQYWLYTPVQHTGYTAIHRAWYRAGTKELLSVEPQEQPLKDASARHLVEFLQSALAGISAVPVIDSATFKKLVA